MSLIRIASLSAVFALFAGAVTTGVRPATAAAGTFSVTTTADSGAGSLRAAIEAANSNANPGERDVIVFDIPGTGVHTITLASPITVTEPVLIDGLTQGDKGGEGAAATCSPRSLRIQVKGSGSTQGINVTAGGTTAGVVFRGLAITNFKTYGLKLSSGAGHRVECSNIGVNATGTAAAGNESGLRVASNGATIGGPDAGNVISGNDGPGLIVLGGNNITVQSNVIGLNGSGQAALANDGHGIEVRGGSGLLIGGTAAGGRNVISGNTSGADDGIDPQHGIAVLGSSGTRIEGNIIGLNSAGTAAIANNGAGVFVADDYATVAGLVIGGSSAAAGNVISGNTLDGVILSIGSDGTVVASNRIGTTADGAGTAGNGFSGVSISAASNVEVGVPGAGNVIAGNGSQGVIILGDDLAGGPADGNHIFGNIIGLLADGETAAPNAGHGVFIVGVSSASSNQVGGTLEGQGNRMLVVDNGVPHSGVAILELPGGVARGNTVRGNAIFASEAGIDLTDSLIPSGTQITPNDPGDTDTGPNLFQNAPVLLDVTSGSPGEARFEFDSTPGKSFTIDFYRSETCGAGARTGTAYLGAVDVVAGTGVTQFEVELGSAVNEGVAVVATATDENGNTSEFSNCATAEPAGAAISLVSVEPGQVVAGSGEFALKATGSGFAPGMVVRWNGIELMTSLVNGTTLAAFVPAELSMARTTVTIDVWVPLADESKASNSVEFKVVRSSSDVDCDGVATASDVMHALNQLTGVTAPGQCSADANQDNETNIADALWIRRETAGLETPKASLNP